MALTKEERAGLNERLTQVFKTTVYSDLRNCKTIEELREVAEKEIARTKNICNDLVTPLRKTQNVPEVDEIQTEIQVAIGTYRNDRIKDILDLRDQYMRMIIIRNYCTPEE